MICNYIEKINVTGLRNLNEISIKPGKGYNIIGGLNGSGKTSLLEAIYHLSACRSFRQSHRNAIIQHGKESMNIFAEINAGQEHLKLGIQRSRKEITRIRLNQKNIIDTSKLASILPLQVIHTQSHHHLCSGPKYRRRLMDWGVFHVEPSFISDWRLFQKALKHRNAAIRQSRSFDEIKLWESVLISHGEKLNTAREDYIDQLKPWFYKFWQDMCMPIEVELVYYKGWRKECNFEEILEVSRAYDSKAGYTYQGPHRADIEIKTHGITSYDMLSQGQQKLLVYCLKLAQAFYLKQKKNRASVLLIDDLPSELDSEKRSLIEPILAKLNQQVFLTSIDTDDLASFQSQAATHIFYMDKGRLID